MTDFRALIADDAFAASFQSLGQYRTALLAALAQPEPQGPTNEELDEFAIYWWGSETDERSVSDVIECGSMAAFARAALARWGRPAIEPVPKREGKP